MTQASAGPRALPRLLAAVPATRRGAGLALALLAPPLVTAVLSALRDDLSLGSILLLFQLAVVVLAVVGGIRSAVVAAVWSFLLANWFLTPPLHSLEVEDRDSLLALTVFLVVALTVSALVDLAASREATAERSRAEARLLGRLASEPVATTTVEAVLGEVGSAFSLRSVALVDTDLAEPVARVGPPLTDHPAVRLDAAAGLQLVADGPTPSAEDRRVLGDLARAAARALEAGQLANQAARGRELDEVDRLRSALLATVSHDLRTPLAGIKAAATGLRQQGLELTPAERDELLATIEHSADRLADMVGNLLDLSRMRAGALVVVPAVVALDEVVARAFISGHLGGVDNAVPDDLPLAAADPALLERVVTNLVDNARRHTPADAVVLVDAAADETLVRLRVVDHGPGVDDQDRSRMFEPFQRLDDHGGAGVGLGLAIASGLVEAMHGTIEPSTTPGGGLTMTVTLPRAVTE